MEEKYKKAFSGKVVTVIDIAFDDSGYLSVGEVGGEQLMWDVDKRDITLFIPEETFNSNSIINQIKRMHPDETIIEDIDEVPKELMSEFLGFLDGKSQDKPFVMDIKQSEKDGQTAFTEGKFKDRLPIEGLDDVKKDLEKLGFKITDEKVDDIFVKCEFPEGWKKVATDHAMHSNLLDPNGNVRAGIFFKAAHYDYKASMGHLITRFYVTSDYTQNTKEKDFRQSVTIRDNKQMVKHTDKYGTHDDAKVIHSYKTLVEEYGDGIKQRRKERIYGLADAWLTKRYADWENPLLYWD